MHRKKNKVFAACFIDVDNFKQINDTLGHDIGDKTLKSIAHILKRNLGSNDYLARLGGDEFAIIIEELISNDALVLLMNKIISVFDNAISVDGANIKVSLSVGVALYPSGGTKAEDIIINADVAMYYAKDTGKGRFAIFDDKINEQVKRRNLIEQQISNALDRNEFYLEYQLQSNITTLQPIGIEALLRWKNPVLGNVVPSEFIPIVEMNGLIHKIGDWILKQALSDYLKILSAYEASNFSLSINVSPLQLESDEFVSSLKNILTSNNINNQNITLEITETSLIKNANRIIEAMDKIKNLGVSFALDDFGVTYSSMQYLKILPISIIKIDRIFIKDIGSIKNDKEIVRLIIQLSHLLGFKTVAEGVETEEQLQQLKEIGCDYIQGYYFTKPVRLDLLIEKLNAYAHS